MNPGTIMTLGWLLDEVEATRPAAMSEEQAIRTLLRDRVERRLLTQDEADAITDVLDQEVDRRENDSLADTFPLTEVLRLQAAKENR